MLNSDKKSLKRMGLLTGLAIGLHNIPEGLATFVATLSSPSLGGALALAIALHNIPEGVCVSMPVYYATGSKVKAFLWAFLSGVSEPLGIHVHTQQDGMFVSVCALRVDWDEGMLYDDCELIFIMSRHTLTPHQYNSLVPPRPTYVKIAHARRWGETEAITLMLALLPSPSLRCPAGLASIQKPFRPSGVRRVVWYHRWHDGLHLPERIAPDSSEVRQEDQCDRALVSDTRNGHNGSQLITVSVLIIILCKSMFTYSRPSIYRSSVTIVILLLSQLNVSIISAN